jgi:hypothetical protein
MPLWPFQSNNQWVESATSLLTQQARTWVNAVFAMFQWNPLSAAQLAVSGGTMTISSVVVMNASYQNPSNTVNVNLNIQFTTSGTATNSVTLTLPQSAVNPTLLQCMVRDNGVWVPGIAVASGTTLTVTRQDSADFHLGTGEQIQVSGSYQSAS